MVDGGNVQVKLGMDDLLDAWPDDVSQAVRLRLATGSSPGEKALATVVRSTQRVEEHRANLRTYCDAPKS